MYNPKEPRDKNGMWTSGDAGSAIKNAASDTAEIKKKKKEKLRAHIELLRERLVEGGISKTEKRSIEQRIEKMSEEMLSLMD